MHHHTGSLSRSASNLGCAATFVAGRAGRTPARTRSALCAVAGGALVVDDEECLS